MTEDTSTWVPGDLCVFARDLVTVSVLSALRASVVKIRAKQSQFPPSAQTEALGGRPVQDEDAKQSQLARAAICSKCLREKELGAIDPKEGLGKTKPILVTIPGPAERKDRGIPYLRSGRRDARMETHDFQVYAKRCDDDTRSRVES